MRPHHRPWLALSGALAIVATHAAPVAARQPPDPDCVGEPLVELGTALSLGAAGQFPDPGNPRLGVHLGLDLAATFPVLSNSDIGPMESRLRIGPWGHLRTRSFETFELTGGLRVLVGGGELDWFGALGQWALFLDGGAGYAWRTNDPRWDAQQPYVEGRIGWGYRTVYVPGTGYPYKGRWCGYDPIRSAFGHERSGRIILSLARTFDGSPAWQATLAVEFDPIGLVLWLSSI